MIGDINMKNVNETYEPRNVTYTLKLRGKLIVIENVPARVCVETGEELFSPDTVECLQRTVWGRRKPARTIQTPVFEFRKSRPSRQKKESVQRRA